MKQETNIKAYLAQKGKRFFERNGELRIHCFFNDCDKDSGENEGHLYFSVETGQYHCKKCGVSGNIVTLARHFKDDIKGVVINPPMLEKNLRKSAIFNPEIIESCYRALPTNIRQYLNLRGISDSIIDKHKLGWGKFYGRNWITIPIKDQDGSLNGFKLRRDPNGNEDTGKYCFYPKGFKATLYGWEILNNNPDCIVICEGEFDCMLLEANGIPAITSTAGAETFKKEWIEHLRGIRNVYICFDKDEAGQRGSQKLIETLIEELPGSMISKITLPEKMEGKDITDYFVKYGGTADELIHSLSEYAGGQKPINTDEFSPLTLQDLAKILGLTIKKDETNKIITFIAFLSAYTDNSQLNISFNAPSSSGKSYIPLEISRLFPKEDVVKLGSCSPNAFYHEQGEYNKEKNEISVNLANKIIIFLDMPSNDLLKRLRPLLSHDDKEIRAKITDKNQRGGNRTKTVVILGFPVFVYCTAGLNIDEQEATRVIMLSPETGQEKVREGIKEIIKRGSDQEVYSEWLEADPDRKLLKERVEAVRQEKIKDVTIPFPEKIEEVFLSKENVQPRNQRDVSRLISFIKVITLLNLWFRKRNGSTLEANEEDFEMALSLWEEIYPSQELGIPPYIHDIYKEVILPAFSENNEAGLSREKILIKHYEIYQRPLNPNKLRLEILPMLRIPGLVREENDPRDKRAKLIFPNKDRLLEDKGRNRG